MDTIRNAVAGILKDHKVSHLAKLMGDLNPSTLYKWSEPSTEMDKHGEIPLRRAIQLTLITSDTRLMEAVAQEAGGIFVPSEQLLGNCKDEQAALNEMKASADLVGEYISAIKDKRITAAEYRKLATAAMTVHRAVATIMECAKREAL
jgi:hypothetical protein